MLHSNQPNPGILAGFIYTALLGLTTLFALCAVYASYQFELIGYTALLGDVGAIQPFRNLTLTVTGILAIGLNGGKIMLLFVIADMAHRYGGLAFAAKALRAVVLMLSLMMTLIVFAGQTISPRAQSNLDAARAQTASDHDAVAADLKAQSAQLSQEVGARYRIETGNLLRIHETRLADLNEQLDGERQVGNQKFKGARYNELGDLIEKETAAYRLRVDELRHLERAELDSIETKYRQEATAIEADRDSRLASLGFDQMFASSEAQHPYMLRATEMVRVYFPDQADPIKVTIVLALVLCFAVELLPMVLFSHLFMILSASTTRQRDVAHDTVAPASAANSSIAPEVTNTAGATERRVA